MFLGCFKNVFRRFGVLQGYLPRQSLFSFMIKAKTHVQEKHFEWICWDQVMAEIKTLSFPTSPWYFGPHPSFVQLDLTIKRNTKNLHTIHNYHKLQANFKHSKKDDRTKSNSSAPPPHLIITLWVAEGGKDQQFSFQGKIGKRRTSWGWAVPSSASLS